VKYFHQHLDRQAALHFELLKMPALDFSSTASDRSVATISVRQPDSMGPASFRHIAIEYGSCPVEDARTRCAASGRAARALHQRRKHRLFQMIERKLVAEEKKVSLVVIASTHLRGQRVGAGLHLQNQFGNSGKAGLARPAGTRRLSTRYCLSADRSRPERSFSSLRRYS